MGIKSYKKLRRFREIIDGKFDVGNPSSFNTQLDVADFLTVKFVCISSGTHE